MACIFVYGFAPGTSQEDFLGEFFEDFNQHEMLQKVDFKGESIFAFVHLNNEQQGQQLIDRWNGQKMNNSKFGLQVRMKGQNNHVKPREPNLFIYGFPKGMTKEAFQNEFFENFPQIYESCIKIDFLAGALQAFIHCADTSHCDELITHWDGRPMRGSNKSLQVRYKGDKVEVSKYRLGYTGEGERSMPGSDFQKKIFKKKFEKKKLKKISRVRSGVGFPRINNFFLKKKKNF